MKPHGQALLHHLQVKAYEFGDTITFEKGDEMGRFKLGSTVVSAFAPNMIDFTESAGPETVTRLGELYGTIPEKK